MSLFTKICDIQKLREAWNRVKKNKPVCGADNITVEEFENNLRTEIKQLNLELLEHRYEAFPVKLIPMRQEEKVREISLFSMRDKVVQTSIAQELSRMFESGFSKCSYAYRSDSSALLAVDRIENIIAKKKAKFFLKTDVHNFFDSIPLKKMEILLRGRVREEDVVRLIMQTVRTPYLDKEGNLMEKKIGLYQGSALSPILSNLYMDQFDRSMEGEEVFYIRYADDILLMAEEKDSLEKVENKMQKCMEEMGLELNIEKTILGTMMEGFQFLGYFFDNEGKAIPQKAKEKLQVSLESLWLTMSGNALEEKLKKGSQIINGWEQYYRSEREVSNEYEYVVLVYMMRYKRELASMLPKRKEFVIVNKELNSFLIEVWNENELFAMTLHEYEQFYGIADMMEDSSVLDELSDVLAAYELLWKREDKQVWLDIMQIYADLGMYAKAERIMERVEEMDHKEENGFLAQEMEEAGQEFVFNHQLLLLFEQELRGREDMYTREVLVDNARRKCEFVPEPLTADIIKKHLEGKETIDTYIARNNDTVKYMVWDVDISKKVLMTIQNDELEEYLQIAYQAAGKIVSVLKSMGLKAYVEFSGYRGFHVWLFLTEWMQLRYAYSFMEIVDAKLLDLPSSVVVEVFPDKSKKKSGSAGQRIKLPYGIHLISGKRSTFLYEDGSTVYDCGDYIAGIAKYTPENIKRVIGANIHEAQEQVRGRETHKVMEDDFTELGEISDSLAVVLRGCNLMKYLVRKAIKTGYLTHMERLSVLNVFGHVGEEGKDFVHKVMEFTLNYNYNTTEKFIKRLPEKPISCVKLREQYKKITAEYGCSCVFKRTRNCYPSPVIHALKDGTDNNREVTIPMSRTLSSEKKEKVYEELNVHVKVQDLSGKIVELKKQKRGIEKSIKKIEKELEELYDNAGVDCMEIELGMLVRKRTGEGFEWSIEI